MFPNEATKEGDNVAKRTYFIVMREDESFEYCYIKKEVAENEKRALTLFAKNFLELTGEGLSRFLKDNEKEKMAHAIFYSAKNVQMINRIKAIVAKKEAASPKYLEKYHKLPEERPLAKQPSLFT
ncbi:MAG: hypothetical protein PHN39_02515 [Candidatus Pacebacteria bacterium]|nr:hypothetical protein [Candidatus Paceibacterota bacterium]